MSAARLLILISIWMPSLVVQAQGTDALTTLPEEVLSSEDSLSIFKLIDSLLVLEEQELGSQLGLRLTYNSNMLSTGRTLGINQFGLGAGLSYYHKTGLYADFSGFWSDEFDPQYYLTILSAGYMYSLSSKISLIASYDHYVYNLPYDYIPYSNALTASSYFDLKPLVFRLDYAYYFGEQNAHRLMPSLGFTLEKRGLLKLNKVSITPMAMVLLGNESITEIVFPSTRQEWIAALIRLRNGLPWYTLNTKNVFGVMNYSFMLPLNVSYKNWNFFISYSYNIPKALPGETLVLSESGFLTASITRLLNLKPNKSLL
jgi:hypothetical protein